jgi:hypothetical protein
MRNYIFFVGSEVYFSVDDLSFQRKVYLTDSMDQCKSEIEETLTLLQGFDPAYHIYQQTDQQGVPQDGPQKYYLKMDKPNMVDLFASVVVFDTVAASVWGCAAFPDVFVRESPRKTWSHGH